MNNNKKEMQERFEAIKTEPTAETATVVITGGNGEAVTFELAYSNESKMLAVHASDADEVNRVIQESDNPPLYAVAAMRFNRSLSQPTDPLAQLLAAVAAGS